MIFFFAENEYIYGGRQGKRYIGFVSKTGNNIECLRWDDPRVISEKKTFRKNSFPDGEIPGPYCRNPFDSEHRSYSGFPWCYYFDNKTKNVEFDSCTQLKVKGKMFVIVKLQTIDAAYIFIGHLVRRYHFISILIGLC